MSIPTDHLTLEEQLSSIVPLVLQDEDDSYDGDEFGDYYVSIRPLRKSTLSASYSDISEAERGKDQGQKKLKSLSSRVKKIYEIINDFFEFGEIQSAVETIRDMGVSEYHDYCVVVGVRLSLDRTEEHQQRMSELITVLYDSKIFTRNHISRAFEKLIQSIDDIVLDVPNAADALYQYFSWASEDGILEPIFMDRLSEKFLVNLTPSKENLSEERLKRLRRFKSELSRECSDLYNDDLSVEDLWRILNAYGAYMGHELVKFLLRSSFSRKNRNRETVSKALNDCYGDEVYRLTPDDVQLGHSRLLGDLDDTLLDNPDVLILMSKFLVRGIVDEILPPSFLVDQKRLHIGGPTGMECLRKAKDMLMSREGHVLAQAFKKVWIGTDSTFKEARDFKTQIRDSILAYFDEGDVLATCAYIKCMDLSPDQASETARKILTIAMERDGPTVERAFVLLHHLVDSNEISRINIRTGFEQIYETMPDLQLDYPLVEQATDQYVTKAKKEGLLNKDWEYVTCTL